MSRVNKLKMVCCGAKLWKGDQCLCLTSHTIGKGNQSQKHGFTFENEIRLKVFGLPIEANDRNIHDIPADKNSLNSNENISIKTTGSSTICCGDVMRFFGYDFAQKNTIICIQYTQGTTHKTIHQIYEIDYNMECHHRLFGNLSEQVLRNYVEGVKSIPATTKGPEAKEIFDYLGEKKRLNAEFDHQIQINPKVDSKQSRVQCSIPKFEETLKEFITYRSPKDTPNMVRNVEIVGCVESGRRKRHMKSI
jgi:hypothetical protein